MPWYLNGRLAGTAIALQSTEIIVKPDTKDIVCNARPVVRDDHPATVGYERRNRPRHGSKIKMEVFQFHSPVLTDGSFDTATNCPANPGVAVVQAIRHRDQDGTYAGEALRSDNADAAYGMSRVHLAESDAAR